MHSPHESDDSRDPVESAELPAERDLSAVAAAAAAAADPAAAAGEEAGGPGSGPGGAGGWGGPQRMEPACLTAAAAAAGGGDSGRWTARAAEARRAKGLLRMVAMQMLSMMEGRCIYIYIYIY